MNLIVDGVKANLIPYISTLDSLIKMYDSLSKLFTIKNIRQVASISNELWAIKMKKNDTLSSYFVRISYIRDELQAIDEIVSEKKFVIVSLLGLPKSWNALVAGTSSWNNYPSFEAT